MLETDTHVEGMRRYSHFEKLHNALMNSSLSLYVKGMMNYIYVARCKG